MHTKNTLYYRVVSFCGKKVLSLTEKVIGRYVEPLSVYNPQTFAWVAGLEQKSSNIRKEYNQIVIDKNMPDIREISEEQEIVVSPQFWRFFPLYLYGIPIQENLKSCPETAQLLKTIPGMTTAFFSVIRPGTFIQPHRGAFRGYLRYHLGVEVPDPNTACGIKILNEIYYWEQGKSLVFDDTFLHEAWNNAPTERVVLYVDFIRPMPRPLVIISQWLTRLIAGSPYIQNALVKLGHIDSQKEVAELIG